MAQNNLTLDLQYSNSPQPPGSIVFKVHETFGEGTSFIELLNYFSMLWLQGELFWKVCSFG